MTTMPSRSALAALFLLSCGGATEGLWDADDKTLRPHEASEVNTHGNETPSDQPSTDSPVSCADSADWTSGSWFEDSDTTTASSWLVPSRNNERLGWMRMTYPPTSAFFELATGASHAVPRTEATDDGSVLPPWKSFVSEHAVSGEFLQRFWPKDDVLPALALSAGSLGITHDHQYLVRVRCARDHTELDHWSLDALDRDPETVSLEGNACPTRMFLLDDVALIADNSPALRYIDVLSGQVLFTQPLSGPSGQIDATPDGKRVMLSMIRGNLIDLEPGHFDADTLVLSVPSLKRLRAATAPLEALSRLSYVNGGWLVPDPEYPGGYIQLPGALHPSGGLTATFTGNEDLLLLDTHTSTARVLERANLPDELESETPRVRGLPTALGFSANGRFLAAVRGGKLSVYRCALEASQ
jgi:hypothetical protein